MEGDLVHAALSEDDQCTTTRTEDGCALNALQLNKAAVTAPPQAVEQVQAQKVEDAIEQVKAEQVEDAVEQAKAEQVEDAIEQLKAGQVEYAIEQAKAEQVKDAIEQAQGLTADAAVSSAACNTYWLTQIKKKYGSDCIDSNPDMCHSLDKSLQAYLKKGGQPAARSVICANQGDFKTALTTNIDKCTHLIHDAGKLGFKLPKSMSQMHHMCHHHHHR